MELEFASITISFLIHSTEDANRLNSEVCASFSLDSSEISSEGLNGHYGNELRLAKAHLIGKRARETAKRIRDSLSDSSRGQVSRDFNNSIDEHDALYLRLDRQTLYSGSLTLSDEEPIRVRMKPRIRTGGHESMKLAYHRVLNLS